MDDMTTNLRSENSSPNEPTEQQEQHNRYKDDEATLAGIGRDFRQQVTVVEVRIPQALGEQATKAWERDESEIIAEETNEEHRARDRASALALIGLAILERGRLDGDAFVVEIDARQISDALDAADDLGLSP